MEFSTYRSINFLSGTASFPWNMKWVQKALYVTITDSTVLENVSKTNTQCALVKAIIITDLIWKTMVRHLLDGATITICLGSLVTIRCQFRMLEVILSYPVYLSICLYLSIPYQSVLYFFYLSLCCHIYQYQSVYIYQFSISYIYLSIYLQVSWMVITMGLLLIPVIRTWDW